MENALWNGKQLVASDIAEDYALEKEIRKASGRKELRCPDPDCKCTIVRYCHGEIKEPFFAHINNMHCDYAIFDSINNDTMRTIRKIIYDSFKEKGYQVQSEIKLLPHHYTHLLCSFTDGKRIAVEIVTQRTSANRIDLLSEQYQDIGIPVKWIVLSNADMPVRENRTFFAKRYVLNESKNRDLMVVDWDCKNAAQYRMDTNIYEYHNRKIHSENYPDIYTEYGSLTDLAFENGEITFSGFHERYNAWIAKKKNAFSKKVQKMESEYQQSIKTASEQKQALAMSIKQYVSQQKKVQAVISEKYISNQEQTQIPVKSYEERRQEILPIIDRENIQVNDSLGNRWVKCRLCGTIDTDDKFVSYGGSGRDTNTGLCYKCSIRERSNN